MNQKKWRSILVPVDVYKGIKAVAALEQRKISGQLRHMFHRYLEMEGIELQRDEDKEDTAPQS
ncbi:hypothetical protein [Hyphomonas sp.]|uniref:hypothetical protein n=1 Tax=Hyphomonas sp. TaxID=87 RepID=UPI000C97D7BE|nr:hypothetical protein [Hyphomonas sp.]MAL46237.1 hypothetical protein [Hyphomonas sp.]